MNGGPGLHPRQCRVQRRGALRRLVDHCVGIVDAVNGPETTTFLRSLDDDGKALPVGPASKAATIHD